MFGVLKSLSLIQNQNKFNKHTASYLNGAVKSLKELLPVVDVIFIPFHQFEEPVESIAIVYKLARFSSLAVMARFLALICLKQRSETFLRKCPVSLVYHIQEGRLL